MNPPTGPSGEPPMARFRFLCSGLLVAGLWLAPAQAEAGGGLVRPDPAVLDRMIRFVDFVLEINDRLFPTKQNPIVVQLLLDIPQTSCKLEVMKTSGSV